MKQNTRRQGDLSILQLLRPIADQFVSTIEKHIDAESRLLADRWLRAVGLARSENFATANHLQPERMNAHARQSSHENTSGGRARVPQRRRLPSGRNDTAPSPDQAQTERTAELNRLRRILQPVSVTPIAEPPPAQPPSATATSTDPVRALEDEIRDAMVFLPGLPPERCAAQIAAWAGKARIHQAHPTDSRTRIAAGLLLKKLCGLADAMDVGSVDALTPGYEWDWARYVAMNEATAAGSGGNGTEEDTPQQAPDATDEFSAVWK